MKIGIIADIHGRYQALQQALTQLDSVDRIFNLGDVADFSPDINRCYDLLKQKKITNIIGNHEQEVLADTGDMDDEVVLLDDYGNELSNDFGVNERNKAFIRQFKLSPAIQIDGIKYLFSHGYKAKVGGGITFEYLTEDNIKDHYNKYYAPINFCGHIHRSQIISFSEIEFPSIQEIEETTTVYFKEDIIYGFNVGILSRDISDPVRLQYAILDTKEKNVKFILI